MNDHIKAPALESVKSPGGFVGEAERAPRVLLLSPFFFPEPISTGKYNAHLARGLAAAGSEVHVLASFPLYPAWKPVSTSAQLPNIVAHRGGLKLRYPRATYARRAMLELWYLLFVSCFLVRRKGFDKIVAVFPPSLFMVVVPLLVAKNIPLVGIVHDLQGVYASRCAGPVARLVRKAISLVEKRAFASCDHLIFLSEAMRRTASAEYGLSLENSSVQYPFVNIEPYDPAKPTLDHMFSEGGPTLVYSGALGDKQAPEKLVDLIIAALDSDPRWTGIIVSQGPIYERLKQEVNHPRLYFFPLVEEGSLSELLERSSIQLIPQEKGTSGGSLPSKLPNIIAANTKLFCVTDEGSEIERIVREYPNGAVSTTWQKNECLAVLRELMVRITIPKGEQYSFCDRFSLAGLVSRVSSVGKGNNYV